MMDYGQFFKLVTRIRRGVAQKLRLNKIHQAAIDSVGCPMGPSGSVRSSATGRKIWTYVRQQIKDTEDLIDQISLDYAEYSYLLDDTRFWSIHIGQSIVGDWRSFSI